jgi:hypothetical protein
MNLTKMLLKGLDAYKRDQEEHFRLVLKDYFNNLGEGKDTNEKTVDRIQASKDRRLKEIDDVRKWIRISGKFIEAMKRGEY